MPYTPDLVAETALKQCSVAVSVFIEGRNLGGLIWELVLCTMDGLREIDEGENRWSSGKVDEPMAAKVPGQTRIEICP